MNNNTQAIVLKRKAIVFMLLSAASFAMMQVIIALLSGSIPLFEQLLFRNLFTTFSSALIIRKRHFTYFGQRQHRPLLLARSIVGYLGMITTFYASAIGNQGDISTIIKMSPFVVTVLAYFFLKEKITKYQIIALCVAFLGAFFVSNPKFNSDIIPIIVAVFACLFSGGAYTLVGALKGKEPPEVIIFVFSLLSVCISLPFTLVNFVMPTFTQFLLLLAISLFAAFGQTGLTYSYAYAKASEVSIYNYSGIFFSMIFGYLFLGQSVKPTSLLGAVLVILAGCIVFFGNNHKSN